MRLLRAGCFALALALTVPGCTPRIEEEPLAVADFKRLDQPHVQAITDPVMRAALVRRDSALTAQEEARLHIVERLDFLPVLRVRRPFFCWTPTPTAPADIDPHRSLFVHDRATLDAKDFSLQRTLAKLASDVNPLVPTTSAVSIFRQLWDTQNPTPGLSPLDPHCTDNGNTVNTFPYDCRAEGAEAQGTDAEIESRMSGYRPLALVNRLDLAHERWRNCGEYRIVYGREIDGTIQKNLIIFEAVLPNPRPGCREGCLPVAVFWKTLSAIVDPAVRAEKLEAFFYDGLPNFREVVHVDHYSATGISSAYGSSGSGQIRTNQFLQSPWMLREFKTVLDCSTTPCAFQMTPISVKGNPFGRLWNEDIANTVGDPLQPGAQDFQGDVLLQKPALAAGTLMGIGYAVDPEHNAAQSVEQPTPAFIDNYRNQMNAAAATGFRTGLASMPLTADQMVNRALALSCAGCHQPSTFGLSSPGSIGTVTLPGGTSTSSWPATLAFVHVDTSEPAPPLAEFTSAPNPAVFGDGRGQPISPALHDAFLPDRQAFLVAQLNETRCPCRNRFRFFADALRQRALQIQERNLGSFQGRLDRIQGEFSGRLDLEQSTRRSAAVEQLAAERERALAEALAGAGIQLPEDAALGRAPHSVRLDTLVSAWDPRRPQLLRSIAVARLLQQEPPRRTVTGSFRVH